MKLLKIASVMLPSVLTACATVPPVPASCEITAYGPARNTPADRPLEESDIDPDVLIGTTSEELVIPENSMQVIGELGGTFGIVHSFKGVPRHGRINVLMEHPEINYESGPKIQGRWLKFPLSHSTMFTFDLPEEVVPGDWSFTFSYKGQELCQQGFVVSL